MKPVLIGAVPLVLVLFVPAELAGLYVIWRRFFVGCITTVRARKALATE